jgi:hypothetical protein
MSEKQNQLTPQKSTQADTVVPGQQELKLPLDSGYVVRFPIGISQDEFDLINGTLQLWKKKIVRAQTSQIEPGSSETAVAGLERPESVGPKPWYNPEGDCIVYQIHDEAIVADRIDEIVTIYRSVQTDNLIGYQINGVTALIKRFGKFHSEERS